MPGVRLIDIKSLEGRARNVLDFEELGVLYLEFLEMVKHYIGGMISPRGMNTVGMLINRQCNQTTKAAKT